MDEVFEFGRKLQADGHYSQAEKCYRRYLEDHTDSFKAMNNLGIVLECQNQVSEAIHYFRAASALVPDDPIPQFNLGCALFREECFDDAREVFETLLSEHPDHASARMNLGMVHWRLGNIDESESHLRAAVEMDGSNISALHKLGLFYFEIGYFAEARKAHLQAAEQEDKPLHHFQVALCDRVLNEHKNAAQRLAHVIELDPTSRIAHEHHVRALLSCNASNDDIVAALDRWDQAIPSDPICAHMRAAHLDDASVSRCSAGYVRDTFSGFAGDFNQTLRRLEYQAPQLVADALGDALVNLSDNLRERHRKHSKASQLLDAGCGTGLCGPLIKPYCEQLVGVDLAPPMLAQAEDLDVYDELIEADLIDYLKCHENKFDAIVAADTFNYFGELEKLFAYCARATRKNAILIFTLEQGDTEQERYRLMPHGRFQHAQSYIEQSLSENHFDIDGINTIRLRNEGGQAVLGWLVCAKKSR